jgi:hypothetical protein
MAQNKKSVELAEPDIRRILDAGRIETELDLERITLADRYLMLQEEEQPHLGAIRDALSNLIVEFENRRWSDRSLITDAQIEKSDVAEIQAEKEYAFIRQRRKLILAKLQEHSLKQKDLALLLNHGKSYTSELLNGIRPFSANDLKLIHLLFQIPLEDLIITIPAQETLGRLKAAIDKISALNPKAKSLRTALLESPSKNSPPADSHDDETEYRKTFSTMYTEGKLALSNK